MANDLKHTPGPWHQNKHSPVDPAVYSEDQMVADCYVHNRFSSEEALANARLIAAAPDLLEALQLFVSEYVELVESGDAGFWDAEKEEKVIKARAAIAKAEGQ